MSTTSKVISTVGFTAVGGVAIGMLCYSWPRIAEFNLAIADNLQLLRIEDAASQAYQYAMQDLEVAISDRLLYNALSIAAIGVTILGIGAIVETFIGRDTNAGKVLIASSILTAGAAITAQVLLSDFLREAAATDQALSDFLLASFNLGTVVIAVGIAAAFACYHADRRDANQDVNF